MDQKIVVAIILGVLVLISSVQAFQLYTIKQKVATGSLTQGSSSAPTVAAGGNRQIGSVPSSVSDLPQMVGGC